jgi:hypothetical protein
MYHAGYFFGFQATKINSGLLWINNQVFDFEWGSVSDAKIESFFIFFTVSSPLVGQQVGYFIAGLLGDAARQ